MDLKYFNPHFHKGSDHPVSKLMVGDYIFQSTLPQGKWRNGRFYPVRGFWFQSTLPQGKWLLSLSNCEKAANFNPHFHKGSDNDTKNFPFCHTYFNPHFHKGSDLYIPFCQGRRHGISIHTSTREVTVWDLQADPVLDDFNPHFHKGSDRPNSSALFMLKDFNPHFHKGSDKTSLSLWTTSIDFNPHFHKGSDLRQAFKRDFFIISIHTSTREVTDELLKKIQEISISIHTSTREVTLYSFWFNRLH